MKQLLIILLIFIVSATGSLAQEHKSWVVRSVNKLGAFIDTMANKNIDHRYIYVPERPWQVVIKYHANDMDLRSTSKIPEEELKKRGIDGELNMETLLKPTYSSSIGAWIGYRGYGLGYSFSLSGSKGTNFSIGATGSNYGVNLRIRKFTTRELDLNMWGYENGKYEEIEADDIEINDDINVRTLFFDGYYLLNGKHFSYAAAYDQSVVQLRSAGSLIIGAMWLYSSLNFANRRNAILIEAMGGIGKTQVHEGSIGVGYAYNWVPVKNLLISVMGIPMITLYNRIKAYEYESNYSAFIDHDTDGKKAIPEGDDDSWLNDVTLKEVGTEVQHGKISINMDARVSVTYNWNRYFFNVYGQWNHLHHKIDNNKVKLNDWFVNASIGIRL